MGNCNLLCQKCAVVFQKIFAPSFSLNPWCHCSWRWSSRFKPFFCFYLAFSHISASPVHAAGDALVAVLLTDEQGGFWNALLLIELYRYFWVTGPIFHRCIISSLFQLTVAIQALCMWSVLVWRYVCFRATEWTAFHTFIIFINGINCIDSRLLTAKV